MTFTSFDTWWWPYLFIFLGAVLPTEIWRWIGIFLSKGLREDSELLVFVRCVANALIAGLIIKLIVFPSGILSDAPVGLRLAAFFGGLLAFQFARQSILIGIMTAEIILLGGAYYLGVF